MNGGHTPGPWVVGPNNPEGDDPYGPIPIIAGHTTIAELWLDDAPVHDFNAMQRSNAHLFAAAPDLLEALHGLFGYASAPLDDRDMSGRGVAWRAARAAIAKATAA